MSSTSIFEAKDAVILIRLQILVELLSFMLTEWTDHLGKGDTTLLF